MNIPAHLDALIKELSRLPGIGPKSASRIAFHMLKMAQGDVERLAKAMTGLKEVISSCSVCGSIAEGGLCPVCSDPARDASIICVVENARDVITIEKTGEYKGLYHVLGGVISPLDGIGPEDLAVKGLLDRCSAGVVKEVVIATNPTIEGDATALYLAKILKPLGIRVMRIARGLPVGSDLEFSDSATIARSLSGRVAL